MSDQIAEPPDAPGLWSVVKESLRGEHHAALRARAERWRPWRAYAALHLRDSGPEPL